MRKNIPILSLVGMTMVNRLVFENTKCNDSNKAIAVIIFTAFAMLNFGWIIVCWFDYALTHPHIRHKWKCYASWQCIISLYSFFSFNNYINKGLPFNCFISYDESVADTMFYLSILLITNISCVEHMEWKKPHAIHNDPIYEQDDRQGHNVRGHNDDRQGHIEQEANEPHNDTQEANDDSQDHIEQEASGPHDDRHGNIGHEAIVRIDDNIYSDNSLLI